MNKNLLLAFLVFTGSSLFSQNVATDFNLNDCNGNPHHLFSELDAGKVIVLAWTMPCSACILPIKTAYNVAKSYKESHPGRVLFYMADDYANTNCASVSGWGTNYIGPEIDATFSDASIKMTDYGTNGMPKIVVLGTNGHNVLYNANDAASGNSDGIKDAINQALLMTKVEKNLQVLDFLKTHPNPASKSTIISYGLQKETEVKIIVYNILGAQVGFFDKGIQNAGEHQLVFDTSTLDSGIYFINFNGKTLKLMVSNQ